MVLDQGFLAKNREPAIAEIAANRSALEGLASWSARKTMSGIRVTRPNGSSFILNQEVTKARKRSSPNTPNSRMSNANTEIPAKVSPTTEIAVE
jgi:hypothetical protein